MFVLKLSGTLKIENFIKKYKGKICIYIYTYDIYMYYMYIFGGLMEYKYLYPKKLQFAAYGQFVLVLIIKLKIT